MIFHLCLNAVITKLFMIEYQSYNVHHPSPMNFLTTNNLSFPLGQIFYSPHLCHSIFIFVFILGTVFCTNINDGVPCISFNLIQHSVVVQSEQYLFPYCHFSTLNTLLYYLYQASYHVLLLLAKI